MSRRYERAATYYPEMQDLLIAMEAAMSVTDPPITTFTVKGSEYELTLTRLAAAEVVDATEPAEGSSGEANQ